MMMSESRVMVITGTSRGIGRGMAEHFVKKGFLVAGCSRGSSTLNHDSYHHSEVDLTVDSQVREWISKVRSKLERVDVLVCNVGLVRSALMMAVTPSPLVEEFFKTNVFTTFNVCREVVKLMLLKKTGRIICLASIMTDLHDPGTAAYSASKSAVIEMTKVLATELAPTGITCNVISPSMVLTEPVEKLGEKWRERMLSRQTIQRPLEIEELCHAVSFFAAPESRSITGQVLRMCLVD